MGPAALAVIFVVDNKATSALYVTPQFVLPNLPSLHTRHMSTFTIHVTTVVKVSSPTNFHYRLAILGSRGKGQGFWNVNVP